MKIHRYYAIGSKGDPIGGNGLFSYISGFPINFKENPLSLVQGITPSDCITFSADPDMPMLFAWRAFFWRTVFKTYKLRRGYYLVPYDEKTGKLMPDRAVTYKALYEASMLKLHGNCWKDRKRLCMASEG